MKQHKFKDEFNSVNMLVLTLEQDITCHLLLEFLTLIFQLTFVFFKLSYSVLSCSVIHLSFFLKPFKVFFSIPAKT